MKKRILTAMLIAAMAVSLAACGDSSKEDTATETSETVETTEAVEVTEAEGNLSEEELTSESDEKAEEEVATEKVVEVENPEDPNSYTYDTDSVFGKIMYTTQHANILDVPNSIGNVVTDVEAGVGLIVISQCIETGWYEVEYATDKVGYIDNAYIEVREVDTSNEMHTAAELLAYGAERGWYPDQNYYDVEGMYYMYAFAGDDEYVGGLRTDGPPVEGKEAEIVSACWNGPQYEIMWQGHDGGAAIVKIYFTSY